jgi:hypothetical protein
MVRIVDNDDSLKGQRGLVSGTGEVLSDQLALSILDDNGIEPESNQDTYDRLGKLQGEYEHLVIEDAQAKELVDSAAQDINSALARLAWLEHCSGQGTP